MALPRRTHTGRLGLLVLGPPADVDHLVAAMLDSDLLDPEVRSVTVPARLGSTRSPRTCRWRTATSGSGCAPPRGRRWSRAESRLVGSAQADQPEIARCSPSPTPAPTRAPSSARASTGSGSGTTTGRLVACGVRERSLAGHPILFGITVDPDARGDAGWDWRSRHT